MKKSGLALAVCLAVMLASACSASPAVAVGNYYLNGDEACECIQIIDSDTMRFVGFDIDYLSSYLINEGAGLSGQEALDYMARHNLPDAFNEQIGYEYDKGEKMLYIQALSSENVDYLVANYRMEYTDKDTIVFMEHTYTRR